MRSNEANEQAIVISWAKMQENKYPALKLLYAIPNGGKRNKIEAYHLKLQGVKAGVPDLFLSYPNEEFHGCYIEMKYGKNKTSKKQNEWIDRLIDAGYKVAVCWSSQEAIEVIKEYLNIK